MALQEADEFQTVQPCLSFVLERLQPSRIAFGHRLRRHGQKSARPSRAALRVYRIGNDAAESARGDGSAGDRAQALDQVIRQIAIVPGEALVAAVAVQSHGHVTAGHLRYVKSRYR